MKKLLILIQFLLIFAVSGKDVPADPLRTAAESGDADAQYKLAE